jgi:hypothetical protein
MMMMSNSMMFINMVIIQFVGMSYVMTDRVSDIKSSLGKLYISVIMGLFMVVAGVLSNQRINLTSLVIFVTLLSGSIYLYKIQYGITDKEYVKEMLEHHSMALLTSKNILQKTKNPMVSNFAAKIYNTQEKEIKEMAVLIDRL